MCVLTLIGNLFKSSVLFGILPPTDDSWTPPNTENWIKHHGYPVESHSITTADGYILTYHRIPHGKETPDPSMKREPVLLHHGLLMSSGDWVLSPNSLGYLLADTGFDVWIGNARGNTYSRKHVSLNPDKDKKHFWNFSWHEMGHLDLPAAIDYILGVTNQHKLFYVGFSMGTTMFFVLGATRPEYMAKIHAATLMAPVAHPWHIPSPVINFAKKISFLFEPKHSMDMYEFFPQSKFTTWAQSLFCDFSPIKQLDICENFLKLIVGFHKESIKRMPLSLMRKFNPAGTSYRTFEHFRQIIDHDFSQYDYGEIQNERHYGSKKPPSYNLHLVNAPIYIHYSPNDWLSVPEDVIYLVQQLPNVRKLREVPEHRFNHLDFVYSVNADTLLYNDIIDTFSFLAHNTST